MAHLPTRAGPGRLQALFHYSFVARKLGCPLDNKLHFVDCVSNLLATSDANDVVIASPAAKRKGIAGPVMHRYKLGNADAPLVRKLRPMVLSPQLFAG